MERKKHPIRSVLFILLLGIFAFSGWKLYEGWGEYRRADQEKARLEQYEPASKSGDSKNKNIVELIARYPDVAGWLKLENSTVSYPFVQTENNEDYLHKTLEGKVLSAGTLFMDCRNKADFSDFSSIIYGHHMQNGSMFGTLKNFVNQQVYWDSHKRGWIYLPEYTLELEIFAAITVHESDDTIYSFSYPNSSKKEIFLAHVKQNANRWRDIGASTNDRFVCLSTCATATSKYRYVLVARVIAHAPSPSK
ncbi:MAG: class B sortase [Oscillospiraceae bacterium]|jgi:sortase B|nr:class B sortase [Oscillospiraceae bacterium]